MSEHLKVLQRMRDDVAGLIEDYNRPGFEQRDLVEERDALDAAISSLRQVPEGYVLAPREPDGRMWSIGRAEFVRKAQDYEDARTAEKASLIADVAGSDIYRAMIAAATTTSGQEFHGIKIVEAPAQEEGTAIFRDDNGRVLGTITGIETTPAQAGAELPNIIDEALELMEMHGMHGEREYQQLAAAHRALARRGGS